ncbi:MAG: glycosyl transferase, partial [Alphaproteobacteria bacterium]|nr:glycosyl transferase [Alphaproteobacteria bacterium]
ALAAIFVMAFVSAYAGTGLALIVLGWLSFFDVPNERSSHAGPVPRGAGLALTPIIAGAVWGIGRYFDAAPPEAEAVAWLALALGALSWLDDRRGLPAMARLIAHTAAVAAALYAMRDWGPFFGGLLPDTLDRVAAGFLWLWFINLFNFMDGIDGISAVETAVIGTGAAIVAALAGLGDTIAPVGVVLAAAALGFVWWNWHPAKIFLGDVGSVPFGFVLGWLLLLLLAHGQWAAALILPLYYLADATITLVRRIVRREKFWQAHRQHFYQHAARRAGHAAVARAVLFAGLALIVCAAIAATGWAWPAIAAAAIVAGILLRWMTRGNVGFRS